MNYIDIIIGVVLVIFAIAGFSKGFIKSLASLVAMILGIYLGIKLSDYVAAILANHIDWSREYLFVIAFVIIFIIVVIIVSLIGKFLDNIISIAALGFFNRIAGLFFGLLKGAILLSVIITLFNFVDPEGKYLKEDTREKSLLYEPIGKIAPMLLVNFKQFDFEDPSWTDPDKIKKSDLDKLI
jgi:membrane protein required for colicin V production